MKKNTFRFIFFIGVLGSASYVFSEKTIQLGQSGKTITVTPTQVTGPYGGTAAITPTSSDTGTISSGPFGGSADYTYNPGAGGQITFYNPNGSTLSIQNDPTSTYSQQLTIDADSYKGNQIDLSSQNGVKQADFTSEYGGTADIYYDPGSEGDLSFTTPKGGSLILTGAGTFERQYNALFYPLYVSNGNHPFSSYEDLGSYLVQGGAQPETLQYSIPGGEYTPYLNIPMNQTLDFSNTNGAYALDYTTPSNWSYYGNSQWIDRSIPNPFNQAVNQVIVTLPSYDEKGYYTPPQWTGEGEYTQGYYTRPEANKGYVTVYYKNGMNKQVPVSYVTGQGAEPEN